MALVPILLAILLLDRGASGIAGMPGIVVILMLVSALSGFFLIRRELTLLLVHLIRAASREATDGLSDRIREASEDEIGKIATTIESITAQLREQAGGGKRRDRLGDGIARVAHAVQAARRKNHLVSLLVEGALESLGGRCAYFVGVDEEAGDFVPRAAAGEEADVAMKWSAPLGEGIPGRCARERRAIVLPASEIPEGAPAFEDPSKSVVAAPVVLGESLHGVLVVHAGGDRAFGDEDAQVLGGYASVAATALGSWSSRDRAEQALDETLAGFAAAVEARDPYALGHAARVARYCDEMAKALRLDDDTRATLRRAALLHDFGKIGLPEALLKKEGRFTPEELERVRTHASTGEKLLRAIPSLATLAPLVRHHHERCDGSGYPDGVSGDAIPLPTHVLIVANAFDVMTSDRSYRKAASLQDALEALRAKEGAWYDKRAVQALVGLDKSLLKAKGDTTESGNTVRGRATASVSVKD